ncbi:hypothetical protein [Zooshikella harenae]|uniref:Uncharacterized protein n=1 Tax=Zooshikella harenae TaxID=2827238 RepID=A0ABS5ZA35_9GAMM|nr:hypothetical protein [Zooshikella harenae]MBU2710613.1 hypothetical protein [Zooshikella harenae]
MSPSHQVVIADTLHVDLKTNQSRYLQGEMITGSLTFTHDEHYPADDLAIPSNFELNLGNIEACLKEHIIEQSKASSSPQLSQTAKKTLLCNSLKLNSGENQSLELQFELPHNCRITDQQHQWSITCSFTLEQQIHTIEQPIQIAPAEPLLTIANACISEGDFTEFNYHWNQQQGYISVQFTPSPELYKEIDHMKLRLSLAESGEVNGSLWVNLQEKRWQDYFNALFDKDIKRCEISFDTNELNSAQQVYAKVKEKLTHLLNQVKSQS